jgi:hypothetical protein
VRHAIAIKLSHSNIFRRLEVRFILFTLEVRDFPAASTSYMDARLPKMFRGSTPFSGKEAASAG